MMTGNQEIFQQAMNQGHTAAWDQMWDKAAIFYRQALEEIPNHPQALTSLGLALIELQDYDQAIQCYQKAAKILPEDPMPLEKIAQLCERTGNIDKAAQASLAAGERYLKRRELHKAIENWERVIRLNPENLAAHSRLALVYERLGEKPKAVTEYLAVASLWQSGGEPDKAMSAITQALKILPNNEEALRALALLRDFKPLPKPARPRGGTAPLRMSQVRQLIPPQDTPRSEKGMDPLTQACQKALTVLAGMLFEGSDDEESERTTSRGLQAIVIGTTGLLRKPVDRTRMMLHISQLVDLQTQGQTARATEELQRAMDVGLEHPAAHFDLGYLLAQAGRLESAVRHLQYAVKSDDFALGARLLLGDIYRKRGKLKDAAVEFLEALKIADSQMVPAEQVDELRQLYEPFIEAYRQREDFPAQERLCDNVYGLLMRPDWQSQLSRARKQLPKQGPKDLPIPLAEVISEAHSSQVIESISTIHQLIQAGCLRSAMEEAFFALQEAPTYLPLHVLMGDLLVKQGNREGAAEKYKTIARTYSMRGESQQAIKLYRNIVQMNPTDLTARAKLIEQLISAGQAVQAIQEFIGLADLYYNLADMKMARRTFTEALRAAQRFNVDRSWRVRIMHRMADIDLQSLDWRQALRIFEQIRTLQPADEKAWTSLVEINLRLGQEQQALAELDSYLNHLCSNNYADKALSFLETLVAENGDKVPFRRRLADLYRQLGRVEDAVTQLDAIGELLLSAGDTIGAIQTIEMIIALNPPNKSEYQQLLDQLRK